MPVHNGSRYQPLPRLVLRDTRGREIPYVAPRIIRTPEASRTHNVHEGDRTDLLAHTYFDDAERFWRICDATLVLWPEELVTRAGRRLDIPRREDR